MGFRDYLRDDEDREGIFFWGTATTRLIVANVVIYFAFITLTFAILPYALRVDGGTAAIVRRGLEIFGFAPTSGLGDLWLWQLVTYAFMHSPSSVLHLLFNMITLYFFGRDVEILYGPRRYVALYLGAALMGALAYSLFAWGPVPLVGASGAVYAFMVVYACHYPWRKIRIFYLLPIEAWLLVTIYIGIDLALQLTGGGAGVSHLAHLGGALAGWLFYRYSARLEAAVERLDERMEQAERRSEEALELHLDQVLAKISREGMAALSKREREVLERASKHYQKRT